MYYPPRSERFPHSNNQFIDDFLDFYRLISVEYKNIIIWRDFNIHAKDNDDEDDLQFSDMIKARGLKQGMKFPTDNKGNTLDLILTGTVSDFNIISVNKGQFYLDYPKPRKSAELVTYRKWKDIDVNDFIADIHIDELKSLDCSLQDLGHCYLCSLDTMKSSCSLQS